jgi:hypothetical protein
MNQDVTLYKIIKLFEDYQESQRNIGLNGFGYGNLIDFGQNLTGGTQTNYPFMFVTPQNISYDENITTYTMSIIFADRLNDDKSNMVDVQSDMSIQAKRLMGWIKRGINNTPDLFDNMDINLPTAGIPFLERFNDYVGGIAIDLEVVVQESIDSCNYYPTEIPETFNWYVIFGSTNSSIAQGSWNIVYPDTLITNLKTGEVTRVKSTLYDEQVFTCEYPFSYSGETQILQFITGSTDGFNFTLDTEQIEEYGYNWKLNVITGITYNNFRQSPVPITNSIGVDKTEYYSNGTSSTFPTNFIITGPPGFNIISFPLSGNTLIPYYNSNVYNTGTTFSGICSSTDTGRYYFTYPEQNFWNFTGDTLSFSTTQCEKTFPSQDVFISYTSGGITHIASGNTWGYLTYVGTCP